VSFELRPSYYPPQETWVGHGADNSFKGQSNAAYSAGVNNKEKPEMHASWRSDSRFGYGCVVLDTTHRTFTSSKIACTTNVPKFLGGHLILDMVTSINSSTMAGPLSIAPRQGSIHDRVWWMVESVFDERVEVGQPMLI
jgi:hypothetical protein